MGMRMSVGAELGQDRAVAHLDQGMDDALGMDEDVEPVRLEVEQPAGLDELQPLVHQRGRIDGHLAAHLPAGMAEGLGGRSWSGARASGVRRNGPPEAVRMTRRTKPGSCPARHWKTPLCSESTGMIDGPGAGRLPAQERPGHDHRFLVGQGHGLAGPDGGQGRPQAGDPGDGRDDEVGLGPAAGLLGAFRARRRCAGFRGRGAAAGAAASSAAPTETKAGPEFADLLGEERQVRPGGQGRDPERPGWRRTMSRVLRPIDAGRTEDGRAASSAAYFQK